MATMKKNTLYNRQRVNYSNDCLEKKKKKKYC